MNSVDAIWQYNRHTQPIDLLSIRLPGQLIHQQLA